MEQEFLDLVAAALKLRDDSVRADERANIVAGIEQAADLAESIFLPSEVVKTMRGVAEGIADVG